jgi:serine/threonine-protein kinase
MYPQVFGKYVLERELARGGMARVVLATLRGAGGFEKRLVVKQIRDELACDDEFVRRFVEEAKTTVNLAHPNIVPVYELGVELGTYFLAMEWVDGVSAAELLRACSASAAAAGGAAGPGGSTMDAGAAAGRSAKRAGLSPEEGAYVGVEVCRALDYAHRRMSVVHRDVTPRNVMIDEEGQVKVIDFGIAAPAATAPSGHGVFGSPGHMPPEQMEGRELTAAVDVFAVAVLLMELWSGRAPFRRRTADEIEAAMRAPHPKPSDADIRLLPLDDAIASAMALDPLARPQQADDLGRALRKFLAGVDLGDVARQLGDRVRDLRSNPPPPAPSSQVLARPASRPTATQVGTKTFAARAEVEAIAPGRLAIAAPELSTRRMLSSPPSGEAGERGERDEEALAVRPIETGPRPGGTRSRRATPPTAAWLGVLGAGALAIVAFFLGRGAATPTPGAQSVELPVPSRIVERPAASAASAPPGPDPTPPSTQPVPASAAEAPPERAGERSGPAAAGAAQLVLLGEGTTVRVDGVPRGAAPARVSVDGGTHTVVFSFAATGETKSASITVRPGERSTLRADFTGAAPVVRVERAF